MENSNFFYRLYKTIGSYHVGSIELELDSNAMAFGAIVIGAELCEFTVCEGQWNRNGPIEAELLFGGCCAPNKKLNKEIQL